MKTSTVINFTLTVVSIHLLVTTAILISERIDDRMINDIKELLTGEEEEVVRERRQ